MFVIVKDGLFYNGCKFKSCYGKMSESNISWDKYQCVVIHDEKIVKLLMKELEGIDGLEVKEIKFS